MLRFFRKIRQKLIEQDNVRKYLLYAIGEILLVVIGILIALQINNWNQTRISNQKEVGYLHSITRDLEAQIQLIDFKIEREEIARVQVEHLLNEFRETNQIEFTEENGIRFNAFIERATYMINNPTYTELLSTGNLEVIRDGTLRNAIVEYYQRMDLTELIILNNDDIKDNLVQTEALSLIDFTQDSRFMIQHADNQEPFKFPSLPKTAQRIHEDDVRALVLVNILKIRWTVSRASVIFVEEDRNRTVELIELIKEDL